MTWVGWVLLLVSTFSLVLLAYAVTGTMIVEEGGRGAASVSPIGLWGLGRYHASSFVMFLF